ncbi:MAG TPA: adenylate/guanylate cyclase domain-containing protein [Casimicrobiaceae bacterium]
MPLPTGNVTFLFTDIEGSTRLWEADRNAMAQILVRHDALLRAAIEGHGGQVFKTVGDGFCAAFDTAVGALSAAAAIQDAVSAEDWRAPGALRVRCALHTGLAEQRDDDYFGPTLNRLARLLAHAQGGETLLTAATFEIVRDFLPTELEVEERGELALKDLARPEHIYRMANRQSPVKIAPKTQALPSIAVLPFLNLSRDEENEYFADGLTEELLNVLAKSSLKVTSRTSAFAFKGKNIDVPTIGRKLGVKTILEGSVRKTANRVRITAQLIDVESDSHLWSETYERELQDIFAVQDEIAGMVAAKLEVSLGVSREKERQESGTTNLAAYDHFLRGRSLQWQRGRAVVQAYEHFRIAVALDPNYADALAWMADSYRLMGLYSIRKPLETLPYAKTAATRALDLAPELAEGHSTLAMVSLFLDHDVETALTHWRRAIEIEPGNVRARCEYGFWGLSAVAGDKEEAMRQTARALKSDPLNSWAWSVHALIVAFAGRIEESLAAAQHAMALTPHSFVAQWSLLECLANAMRHREVLDRKEDALEISARHPWMLGVIACAHAAVGEKQQAKLIYDELVARESIEYVQPATLAGVAASAGLDAEAIEWAGLALKQYDTMLIWSKVLPSWSALRRLESYEAVYAQLGFGTSGRNPSTGAS